ncbi:MAG: lipid-A-disaccharide synthase [Alistipes sp.]|nr:lipid-A-disaccharide synthase [Alistipes sp.]MBO7236328.1 lipid-A-disaccharide synthase [Alistipes sp.]
MKYYIISGEPSGDLHGGKLMRGITKEDDNAVFRFCGGDAMAAVAGGDAMLYHYKQMSFFGFVQVARNLRTIFSQIDKVKRDIESFNPDVVILIDYPAFNLRIAKWAKSKGVKVYYYIAPKVWAWKERRVKSLQRYVDRLYTIFPFETEYFRNKGIEPIFCGNPLVDDIAERRAMLPEREVFIRENRLDERPIVALLAGSRVSEIRANLPDMVAVARTMPEYQFVVTAVGWIDRAIYDEYISGADNVRYLCDRTQQTLALSEAAVVTSGTATLETALMAIPEVVLYHVPWLYERLKPYFLKIPFISLVNINLGRESVKELVRASLAVEELRGELLAVLRGGEKRERMLKDFDELRLMIGSEGASERFAKDMVNSLKR